MKILVDEMPKQPYQCLFRTVGECKLKLGATNCFLESGFTCPYLKEVKQYVDDGK